MYVFQFHRHDQGSNPGWGGEISYSKSLHLMCPLFCMNLLTIIIDTSIDEGLLLNFEVNNKLLKLLVKHSEH